MKDVIVIGNGPAGISAAIYASRAGRKTLVIGANEGALEKSEKIENYYGFKEPIEGRKLVQNGIEQAERLGVEVIKGEVTRITFEKNYVVETSTDKYESDIVILATGTSRRKPKIQGLEQFEGKGVSYCATCDSFFYRGKDVVVIGSSNYALSEALELKEVAKEVTIVTNGEKPVDGFGNLFKIIDTKIKELVGDDKFEKIVFEDGSELTADGVFIAMGVAGSSDLAKSLGVLTDNSKILVNEKMGTNLPGFYAAGDCTGGLLQISKAVYQGAVAGTEAAKYHRSLNN